MTARKSPAASSPAADSFNQICTVKIELLDTDPLIWREVEVPTSWDPKQIEELPLRYGLSRIANRRNAARARIAKKVSV